MRCVTASVLRSCLDRRQFSRCVDWWLRCVTTLSTAVYQLSCLRFKTKRRKSNPSQWYLCSHGNSAGLYCSWWWTWDGGWGVDRVCVCVGGGTLKGAQGDLHGKRDVSVWWMKWLIACVFDRGSEICSSMERLRWDISVTRVHSCILHDCGFVERWAFRAIFVYISFTCSTRWAIKRNLYCARVCIYYMYVCIHAHIFIKLWFIYDFVMLIL